MKRLYWRAIGKSGRIETINDISTAIYSCGYISEFKRFSDISLSIIIEITGKNIPTLTEKISKLSGLDHGNINSISEDEQYIILLHLSFPEAAGNLEIEVPAVPG
ncbi:MAG: hypothetical protein HUU54_14665 [Ignavibacteriaceae bacterium]|nr:hypothetical protein [Ignavibacteriaceae bacterium]